MRFSGCNDVNGKPIHNGDILQLPHFKVEVWYEGSVNQWLVRGGFLSGNGLEYYASQGRIIDNIKDNPELIE